MSDASNAWWVRLPDGSVKGPLAPEAVVKEWQSGRASVGAAFGPSQQGPWQPIECCADATPAAFQWYFVRGGKREGPMLETELVSRIRSGTVGPDDVAWTKSMSAWTRIGDIPSFAPLFAGTMAEPPPLPDFIPPSAPAAHFDAQDPTTPIPSDVRSAPSGSRLRDARQARKPEAAGSDRAVHPFFRVGPAQLLLLGLVAIGSTVLLLSFHVVRSDDGYHFVAKRSLTFSDTFITVDEVVNRWNRRSFGERMRGNEDLEALVRRLEERDLIQSSSRRAPLAEPEEPARSQAAAPAPVTASAPPSSLPRQGAPARGKPSQSTIAPGERLRLRSLELAVVATDVVQRVPGGRFGPALVAPRGKAYAWVIWSLTNISNEPIYLTGYLFSGAEFVDSSGRTFAFEPTATLQAADGRPGWRDFGGPINPGDTIDQCAAFLVPEDAVAGGCFRLGMQTFGDEVPVTIPVKRE